MNMAFQVFQQSSRRTGRTERLLQAARPGDVIVTASDQEKRRLQRLLRDMGKEGVGVSVISPKRHPLERHGTNSDGATMFDHTWIEAYWEHKIGRIHDDIQSFEEALSRFEPPERESEIGVKFERWELRR